jgi:hypothetical protein
MGIGQIAPGRRHPTRLNQRAELQLYRVQVGVPPGTVAKTLVGVTTGQRPVGGFLQGFDRRMGFGYKRIPLNHEDEMARSVSGRLLAR